MAGSFVLPTMPAYRSTLRSVRRTVSTVGDRLVAVVTTLAFVGGTVGWSLFWSNVARLHYAQGELPSALFTAAVYVAPAVAVLGWYLGETLGVDVPTPSLDVPLPSN